jgi:hypothetical protein
MAVSTCSEIWPRNTTSSAFPTRGIYTSLPDAEAKKLGMIRVIDESGEDYLFPKDRFVPLPPTEF